MATLRRVFLDDDDVTAHVAEVKAKGAVNGVYNALSTICVGKKGANYILRNFRIDLPMLDQVFKTCDYEALGITDANSEYFDTAKPSGSGVANRATGSGYNPIAKGSDGKIFSGRKVKFPISTTMASGLRVYFQAAGGTKTRKNASILFPNIATIPQIGVWLYTHLEAAKRPDIPYFIMPSGTKYFIRPVPDPAALDLQVGEFAAATAASLDDSGDVQESTP